MPVHRPFSNSTRCTKVSTIRSRFGRCIALVVRVRGTLPGAVHDRQIRRAEASLESATDVVGAAVSPLHSGGEARMKHIVERLGGRDSQRAVGAPDCRVSMRGVFAFLEVRQLDACRLEPAELRDRADVHRHQLGLEICRIGGDGHHVDGARVVGDVQPPVIRADRDA